MLLKHRSLTALCLISAALLSACAAIEPAEQPAPVIDKAEFCEYDRVFQERMSSVTPKKSNKVVLGWIEHARIAGTEPRFKAKLDSGAETSSVNAEIVREFEKDDKEYILYHLKVDDKGEQITFESPITRWVQIRSKSGGYIRRPVVEMEICVGGIPFKGEVNLSSRDHFTYPMLIGRNMLRQRILVDSSATMLAKQECE